jgi:alkylated DNA repair dioxygenase AlkB
MEQYIIEEDKCSNSVFMFVPNFLPEPDLNLIRSELDSIDDWKHTTKYDRTRIQRKQKWYQLENKSFGKNWRLNYEQWKSHPYSENLLNFQNLVQEKVVNLLTDIPNVAKPKFNSLLINYYETGDNYIVPHQDDKNSFGSEPTIALLSFGTPRTFCLERTQLDCLKRDKEKSDMNKEFILTDNSALIMAGSSQRLYCHSLKREPEIKTGRHSLSFRQFI